MLKKFEISDKSTENDFLRYPEALEYVKSLGEGWRLPTIDELRQIYNSKNDFNKNEYWSSTNSNDIDSIVLDFYDGSDYCYDLGMGCYVRAVKDIVVEPLTIEISDKAIEGKYTWQSANEYVNSLGDGWRLPTSNEMYQISQLENDFEQDIYWSCSHSGSKNRWCYSFHSGNHNCISIYQFAYVRPVRDIQMTPPTTLIEISKHNTIFKSDFYDALTYIKEFHDGWRLPTLTELQNMFETKPDDFKQKTFWSSTQLSDRSTLCVENKLDDTYVSIKQKTDMAFVRMVRDY